MSPLSSINSCDHKEDVKNRTTLETVHAYVDLIREILEIDDDASRALSLVALSNYTVLYPTVKDTLSRDLDFFQLCNVLLMKPNLDLPKHTCSLLVHITSDNGTNAFI